MTIEIVDFPIDSMGDFPVRKMLVYQRVYNMQRFF